MKGARSSTWAIMENPGQTVVESVGCEAARAAKKEGAWRAFTWKYLL